ncbi:MAG: serine hydrolase domain-containing protein [Pseudomonadota bacterium]
MQPFLSRIRSCVVRRARIALLLSTILAPSTGLARIDFDPATIEQWADDYFLPRIEAGLFNGASFGLIQNGEVRFLKGYGFEDQAAGIPLDPAKTLIRMCSISKTFTATALLQLRDRGLIASLDDPVNAYLKRYQLPPPLGPDVTIRQLMTHSSGMAGHFTPQGTTRDLEVPVSSEIVAEMFHENIERGPGTIGQYANLGVALESVPIEDVTGQPLADYVEDHIIASLTMGHTLLHHVTAFPDRLAQPYGIFPNGELQAVPFFPKHPLTAASGGIISTPEDMLRYAAMHASDMRHGRSI